MPVAVICPSCAARLNAPDQLIGKRVKCPKCQSPVAVPDPANADGFEVIDDAPPARTSGPVAARARPVAARAEDDAPVRTTPRKPVARDDEDDRPRKGRPVRDEEDEPVRAKPRKAVARDDEDEDEDDDRPRKKPAKKSKLPLIVLGVGVLGVVLFGGLLAGAYYLTQSTQELASRGGLGPNGGAAVPNPAPRAPDPAGNGRRQAQVPAGWEKFNDPLGEVEIYFPGGQPGKNEALGATITQKSGAAGDVWMKQNGDVVYMLIRSTVPAAEVKGVGAEKAIDDAAKGMVGSIPGARQVNSMSSVDDGKPTRLLTLDIPTQRKRTFVRLILAGNRLLVATATGPRTLQPADPAVGPFVDNFHTVK